MGRRRLRGPEGFDRGKQAGVAEGFDRGKQAGVAEGQIQALRSILAARGLPVDAQARATIEACQDPEVVARWIARALTAVSTADLFTPAPA